MQQIEKFKIFQSDKHSRAKDLTNQVFGDYLVIYRTECPEGKNPNHAWWLCQCTLCKQYFIKQGSALTKKTALNECDCRNDLVGQKIGRWTVEYLCEQRTKKRGKIYHCKCECGNEKDVPAETLKRGESKSCGCLNREKIAESIRNRCRIDLTGQRFGKLVAMYPIYSTEGKHTTWHCKCDCGNECDVQTGHLKDGLTRSCGCTKSFQEENIIKLLKDNNIFFQYQYSFNDFKQYKFDFYINNQYIIEFDGKQHFLWYNTSWNNKENVTNTHNRDLIKNQYCFNNNIPIIRIPYDKEYDIKDLQLETTNFLLTKDNENDYYKERLTL